MRLRPGRCLRGLGGHVRHRHQDRRPHPQEAAGGQDGPRGLRRDRPRLRGGVGGDRARARARRHGDDRPPDDPGGRGRLRLRLPARCRRRAPDRARRARRRHGGASRAHRRGVPRGRRARDPHGEDRVRAPAPLERAQIRLRRLRPDLAGLHGDGRRHPAHEASLRASPRERDRRGGRPARRQRVPRRRRQPPSESSLRPAQAGRRGARGGGRRRDHEGLRRGRARRLPAAPDRRKGPRPALLARAVDAALPDALLDKLRATVGTQYVLTGVELSPYVVEGRTPEAAVFPGSVDEVAAVIGLAADAARPVTPWGGGTAASVGMPAAPAGLVLGLRRLSRLLEHEPGDLTASVEAGMTVEAFQTALRGRGQWVSLDPADARRATLGGVLATNASGPRRHLYGTARDLLIGVTVVTADGTVVRGGGKVVKNVAGYDLPKLFVGSYGTL